jgi:hypothetical protein
VKEQSAIELAVGSLFWPTLQHCVQLQKFCETMPDHLQDELYHLAGAIHNIHDTLGGSLVHLNDIIVAIYLLI